MDHTFNPSAREDAQHDQAHPMTQYFNMSRQPPGAEIAYLQPSAPFQQAESSSQGLFAQPATEIPTSPIPFYVHSQGEESDTTPYAPGFPNRIFPSSHPMHEPYPPPLRLETPSDGRSPVSADPYAGPHQLTPTLLNFESETIRPTPSLASQSANFVTHSTLHFQAPDRAASSFPRRYSEADVTHRKDVFLPVHPRDFVNRPTSTVHSSVPEHPASPFATLSTQYPAAGPTDTIQETSPRTQDDPAAYGDPDPSPSSSDLLDDSVSVTSLLESASPGPSDGAGHDLQQGTASSSSQKRRRTGKRKRDDNPTDPNAARRLRNQRKDDDECAEALFDLLVPRSVEKGPKKGRLRTILHYARMVMGDQGGFGQDLLTSYHELGGGHST